MRASIQRDRLVAHAITVVRMHGGDPWRWEGEKREGVSLSRACWGVAYFELALHEGDRHCDEEHGHHDPVGAEGSHREANVG